MSFKVLRPQIKTILENTNKFSEVSGTPKLNFNGFPAVYVIPSDNESDYSSTSENQRIYAFVIRCFYETKSDGVSTAFEALEDLVDEVLNAIDEDSQLDDTRVIGKDLPSGYTYIDTFASPTRWAEVLDPALIMAEISVRVKVIVDISN